MQDSLFDAPAPAPRPARPLRAGAASVVPAAPAPDVADLAAALHARFGDRLRLGTSSWNFPGWRDSVWGGDYAEATLSRRGLSAYSQHPLLGAVSLDRAFYRPLDAATYAGLVAQVPADFRFVVKAAAMVSDATVRDPSDGRALMPNPLFLDPQTALGQCVHPAVQGLGERFGALVFQLSPLPRRWLDAPHDLIERLERLWQALRPALPAAVALGLELRDAELLTPTLAASLRQHGVRYCVGLHDRMPAFDDQLPMLRALWPGDLLCRWNLQHGLRYAQAKDAWAPFDRLQAPDPATREALARVIAATLTAGHRVMVTINNKAEGSAPLSVVALAREVLRQAAR